MNRTKYWVIVLVIIIFFIGISFYHIYSFVYKPMLVATSLPVIVQVDKSTTAAAFVNVLKEKNLIHSKKWFLKLLDLTNLSTKIKAGIYKVQPGETVLHFIKRVIKADVLKEKFVIIPGTNENQVLNNLKKSAYLNYNIDSVSNLKNLIFSQTEGSLLADTYIYDAGSNASDLFINAQNNLSIFLNKVWKQRDENLPWSSPYELLIAASILEKEASIVEERKIIAGVIINRLKHNMRLQMDPTVIYAMGSQFQGKLSKEDLKIDSPYNSYKYKGLPPTPIAMVGRDSILAAAHPKRNNYFYFVAKGDGTHEFSVTYEEQKKAIAKYSNK